MPVIESIYIAPVKSLALSKVGRVEVNHRGIEGDRRFLALDDEGRAVTQRQVGMLAQIAAEYSTDTNTLVMRFPNGDEVVGIPETESESATVLWGRVITGSIVAGEWAQALSDFCGVGLRLMMPDAPGACFDEYPVSLISQSSIDMLGSMANGEKSFEAERFRPTFLLGGCEPHEEDSWLGKGVRIGERLRLRIISQDPRCAITTLDPATGKRDFDTLRLILGYRPNPRAAYFGVYGIVESPGTVSVGDEISLTM